MSDNPLVTVIICAYNPGGYLKASLDSILSQSHRNLEILVIDDGSTDNSIEFVAQIDDERVRLLRQENCGKPVAMNRGIEEARGEFYAIHDADDLSHPLRIERQIEVFMREPDVAAVYCGHELVLGEKRYAPRFREKGPEACRSDIEKFRMPAHDPTGMYRLSMVRQFRYDPSLPIAEGLDYVLRVGEIYPMVVVGECLYSYRIHEGSLTKKDPNRRVELAWKVRRDACERRGLPFASSFTPDETLNGSRRVVDNYIATDFMESVVDLRRAGRWIEAIYNGCFCVSLCPSDPYYYKALIFALMPEKLRSRIRQSERAI